jgi:hypothetical protein
MGCSGNSDFGQVDQIFVIVANTAQTAENVHSVDLVSHLKSQFLTWT